MTLSTFIINLSCNFLCHHPLQTEDELELVNEVIFFPHVSHWHELMVIDCLTSLAWLQHRRGVSHRFGFSSLTYLGIQPVVPDLTACGSGLMVVLFQLFLQYQDHVFLIDDVE